MLFLNLSHPLTPEQLEQVRAISEKEVRRVINIPVHFDGYRSYAEQVAELVDGIDLTPQQWQNELIVVNSPSFNFTAVVLLAELHGRMGYFPPCLQLRPVEGSLPPRFEVAEILNLQEIREKARQRRQIG
ncbi:MAG: hypothetical protein D6748_07870 [Calditrichaeota bacterium]|nr:MAG: hypothetical protein D6748_07870 [Calditrichota bacterium]